MFLACQHLKLLTNPPECWDQSWFKVQAVPVFILINVRCFLLVLQEVVLDG
jgi:hypothetical protein